MMIRIGKVREIKDRRKKWKIREEKLKSRKLGGGGNAERKFEIG
jgi:hypothetical protein